MIRKEGTTVGRFSKKWERGKASRGIGEMMQISATGEKYE